ncbi:MAG: ribulose-bisphosphate carboxylase large subunit family protein [Burkholderiaceae bacterium]
MSERILATYWVETPYPLEQAVEVMAGEQSSGTFTRLAHETDALRLAHGARVERIDRLDAVATPSLPMRSLPRSVQTPPIYQRAQVALSWPIENMGPSLPNLMATVAGNLFELKEFSGLRLLDLTLPAAFARAYRGPAYGIEGTRRLAGVARGPLIGTIIKPSVGLSVQATADIVRELVDGGIDFIKDDELQANGPHNPFTERVDAVMRVINDYAQRTGRKPMMAFNITGDIDEMRRHHDHVLGAGGSCVMVSLNAIGLPALASLREYSALPIHGHRAGWGLFSRSPFVGISYLAYQKFWRLAGADHMHVNGLRNKFSEPDDSVIASARACQTPMFAAPANDCRVMPVFSSGQSAEQAADTHAALGNTDLIYCCGGGIMAHPGGIAAGITSLRQAWTAAESGIALEEHARDHRELAQAIEMFRR